jgi:hypothetical protein
MKNWGKERGPAILKSSRYHVSRSQLEQVGAAGMLTAFSRLSNALCFAFPELPWSLSKFSVTRKKSTQRQVSFPSRGLPSAPFLFPKSSHLLKKRKLVKILESRGCIVQEDFLHGGK